MNKLFKKSIIMLICIFIMVGFLLATAASGQEEKKVLSIVEYYLADIGNTEQYNKMMVVYNSFEAEFGCKLDINSYSWSDSGMQLMIMNEANALPDVAQYWYMGYGPLFVAKGMLDPMDSFIAETPNVKDNIEQRIMLKINGKAYGISNNMMDLGLYVNKTILDKNGIKAAPKTWQELRDTAIKCTDNTKGIYGIALDGGDEESLLVAATFIAQNGGHVGLFEGKQGINQPAAVEAVQFIVDMVNKDKSVPGYISSGMKEARDIFCSGGTAFLIDGANNIRQIIPKNPEFEWYTTTLPMGKQNGTSIAPGDTGYSLCSTSKNKDLAWEFIRYMTLNEEVVKQIITSRINYPVSLKSLNEFQLASETYGKYLIPFDDQLKLGGILDFYSEMPNQIQSALNIWREQLHLAVLGKITVQEAMNAVASGWDKLNADWVTQYGTGTAKTVAPPIW